MAFFEPLDHLIAMCPLSIQKMERTGGFLMGEEPDPMYPYKVIIQFQTKKKKKNEPGLPPKHT